MILLPESQWGLIVLMNAENSLDDFTGRLRMASIANGVSSLLVEQQVPPPSSNAGIVIAYAVLLMVIVLQVSGIIRSVMTLQRGQIPRGPFGPR